MSTDVSQKQYEKNPNLMYENFNMMGSYNNKDEKFSNSEDIATYAQQFSITSMIMQRLPYIILGFGILFLIILYAKSRESVVSL